METNFSGRSKFNLIRKIPAAAVLSVLCAVILWSCANKGKDASEQDSADSIVTFSQDEHYHADNDIAMTLRSVADALNQGEELDSLDYNYEGILTDGAGHPLYTDIQGTPGVWSIKVVEPGKLTINNLYLGDLLPGALETYITQCLGLDESNIVKGDGINRDDADDVQVYKFNGGYLIFKTHTAITPKGDEGPLMTITATSELPKKS